MTEPAVGDEKTCFLAELLGSTVPREHEIRFVRELDAKEREELVAADELVSTLATSAAYQRCRDVLDIVSDGVMDLCQTERPAANQLQALRAAVESLVRALAELADDLVAAVDRFLDGSSPKDFRDSVARAKSGEAWRDLARVADPGAGSFKMTRDKQLAWQGTETGEVLLPGELAQVAVAEGQVLLVEQFLVLDEALQDAAKRLRQVAVETPEGRPAIIDGLTLEAGAVAENASMTPRELAVDRISVALGSARLARRIRDDEPNEGMDAVAEPPPQSVTDRAEPPGSTADAAPDEPPTEEDTPDEGPSPPLPVDFASLPRLVRTLNESLEREWSRALDAAALMPAVEEKLAALMTMLSTLQRKMKVEDSELEAAGFDPRVTEWPLGSAALAQLDVAPDQAERTRQLRLAQLDALIGVLDAAEALKNPSSVTVSFGPEESVERFWEAGAFAVLRSRTALLERLTSEHERIRADLLGEPARARAEVDAFERLQLAGHALTAGDPEAAMFHAIAAIAQTLAVDQDLLPAVEEAADDRDDLDREAVQILKRATEVTTRTLEGNPNVASATLLAEDAVRTAHALVIGPLPKRGMSGSELADLIESQLPALRPLESEDGSDDPPAPEGRL